MCVFRPFSSLADNVVLVEKEKPVIPHHFLHHHHQQQHLTQQQQHYTSVHSGLKSSSLSEETRKPQQPPPHKMNAVLPSDIVKSRISPNPNPAQLDSLKQKPQNPNNCQSHPYPNTNPADHLKAKPHPGLLDISKPKPNTSPEVSKHKIQRYSDASPPPTSRLSTKIDITEPPRSCFKPVPPRSESGGGTNSSSTKSPLIIDKNETFTVYRDPALVCSDVENSVSATVSSNHVAAYLHPHLHTLHSPSPHSPCLTTSSHPHATSHLLAPPHTSALPHPHLLPLPAMPPPTASLLGGHPRLDSPGGLGHLGMPHPAAAHQQQFLQVRRSFIHRTLFTLLHLLTLSDTLTVVITVLQGQGPPPPSLLAQAHSGAAGLSLFPILWQYPNGTSYQPGLNLPHTAKWVHPENPVSSEASLRRVSVLIVIVLLYLIIILLSYTLHCLTIETGKYAKDANDITINHPI